MIEYVVFSAVVGSGFLAYCLYPKPAQNERRYSERHKCESYIERRLYDALVTRGYSVNTQVSCGKYRIDLALVGPRLAIECDGKDYHSSPVQKAHDRRKNAYLRRHGWKVIRCSGRQINGNLQKVLQRIEDKL